MDYTIGTFEDKQKIYKKFFSTGYLSLDLNDKLVLISLVALVSDKMKKKNQLLTTLEILKKITNSNSPKDDSFFYEFLERLAIIVDDFSYGSSKFDSCGLKSSEEIIKKIKILLDMWLPF